jgi:mono/diheme cytochrome c family protein
MNRKWLSLLLVISLVLVFTACTGGKESAPKADAPAPQAQQDDDQGDHEETDMDTEDREGEDGDADVEAEDTTAEEGETESPPIEAAEIYADSCAGCHGDMRQGNPGPPLLPENLTQDVSVYADTITNGKGSIMPAWGNTFNEDIINALAEWLKTPVE